RGDEPRTKSVDRLRIVEARDLENERPRLVEAQFRSRRVPGKNHSFRAPNLVVARLEHEPALHLACEKGGYVRFARPESIASIREPPPFERAAPATARIVRPGHVEVRHELEPVR